MILSGLEIQKQVQQGNIVITPFNEKHVGPNSYDVTLVNRLAIYDDPTFHREGYIDSAEEHTLFEFDIPSEGLILKPNILYLGRTSEYTESSAYVPMLEGRSSIGRLGMNIHITAGFGDIGFKGYWTLEISVIHPLKIYPNTRIGQLYFHTIEGEHKPYTGKYLANEGIQASQLYKDFQ